MRKVDPELKELFMQLFSDDEEKLIIEYVLSDIGPKAILNKLLKREGD